jgi:large subunit ribosomal protein L7/L12
MFHFQFSNVTVIEVEDNFKVILKQVGIDKIQIIKIVRELTGLGLKESKDLVDSAPPITLFDSVGRDKAEDSKKKLEEVGVKVEIQKLPQL